MTYTLERRSLMGLSYGLSETVEMLVPYLEFYTLSYLHTFAILFYHLDDQRNACSISSTQGGCCSHQAHQRAPKDTSIEKIDLHTHKVVRPTDA
jgi:hypothetical protein